MNGTKEYYYHLGKIVNKHSHIITQCIHTGSNMEEMLAYRFVYHLTGHWHSGAPQKSEVQVLSLTYQLCVISQAY